MHNVKSTLSDPKCSLNIWNLTNSIPLINDIFRITPIEISIPLFKVSSCWIGLISICHMLLLLSILQITWILHDINSLGMGNSSLISSVIIATKVDLSCFNVTLLHFVVSSIGILFFNTLNTADAFGILALGLISFVNATHTAAEKLVDLWFSLDWVLSWFVELRLVLPFTLVTSQMRWFLWRHRVFPLMCKLPYHSLLFPYNNIIVMFLHDGIPSHELSWSVLFTSSKTDRWAVFFWWFIHFALVEVGCWVIDSARLIHW